MKYHTLYLWKIKKNVTFIQFWRFSLQTANAYMYIDKTDHLMFYVFSETVIMMDHNTSVSAGQICQHMKEMWNLV